MRYPGTTLLPVVLDLRRTHPEFRDPAVRRALLQAIDRDAIVADVLAGQGARADAPIPPTSAMFDPAISVPLPADREAASAALVKAGWSRTSGGWTLKGASAPVSIEVLSPEEDANPIAYRIAASVTRDWSALGLAATHRPLPAAELVGDRLPKGDFSAAVVPMVIGLDPDLYPLLASTQTTSGGSNYSGLQDAALDALLVAARAPGTEASRKAAYSRLQERLAAMRYLLPIAFRDEVVVLRDTVQGPVPRAVGGPGDRFWDVLTWRLADGR
jgi:ABC-type transport system substrate-binding protein